MKKQIMFFFAIIMIAQNLSSCSNTSDEKTEPIQLVVPVQKSARMLSFESSLKDWFKSRSEASEIELSNQNSNAIQIQAKALLSEIGISQSIIDSKTNESELVQFTMDEYSRKLSEMYNHNTK